ncbi:hypothetical protein JW887_00295 [Candidatus Dojkabacteria bacterium]|nr:hypothetical protein [Candidatus Dojkabacteria bacterium]
MKINKAIITAAGRGTRFLPVVKSYAKEMVPVMEKPQLQYLFEELIEADIHEIAVVVREGSTSLQDYLNDDDDLWAFLKDSGKEEFMDSWKFVKENSEIRIFEQKKTDPYGNGVPFIIAREFTNNEPVAAMFGDGMMIQFDESKPSVISQMIDYYQKYLPVSVMSVVEVPASEVSRYGIFGYYGENEAKCPYHANQLIEKPEIDKSPSNMANADHFVLSPEVFEELENKIEGKGGEIWLTDAISRLIGKGKVVIAAPWEGSTWVTTGDPLRWLKANVVVALNNSIYKDDIKTFLAEISDSINSENMPKNI